MSTKVAELAVKITGDGSSASRALDQVSTKSSSFASKASKAGAVAGKVLAGGLIAAGAAAFKATQAAAEDEAAQSKLAQTLTKAGHASREQIAATEDWITAQGKAKGVADDELRPALSQLVAVTHDVGKSQKLATLAMDISAARGVSLESVTKSLAKAQTNGAAGLAKLGVQTKDAAGKTLSLDAVQRKLAATYGGAAAKAAETTAGKQKILSVQFGELQEQIGAKLLPVLLKLSDIGLKVVDWISRNTTVVGVFLGVLASLLAITYAVGVAVKLYTAYTKVAAATQWLLNAAMTANPIGLVVIALAALAAGLVIAYKKSETFRAIVDGAFKAVRKVIVGTVSTIVGFVKSHWKLLLAILTGPFGLAVLGISKYGGKITAGISKVLNKAKSIITSIGRGILAAITLPFRLAVGSVNGDAGRIVSNVIEKINRLLSAARGKVGDIVGFFKGLPGRIVGAVGDLGSVLKQAGIDILQGLLDGLKEKWEDVKDFLGSVTDKIPDWKGPPSRDAKLLKTSGQLIMQGLVDGIDAGSTKVRRKLTQLTQTIKTGVQATTATPLRLDAGTAAGIAGGNGKVAYIVVQGAVDRVGTARQIRRLLDDEATWSGRLVKATA